MPLIQDSMAVFAYCTAICALVMWTTRLPGFKSFYKVIPYVVLIYYLPTFSTALGILPLQSAAYDWMRDYLLPFSLFILMVTADVPTILRIGPKAVAVMLLGTIGVVIGGPVALMIFGHWLPPDTWKGLAALSGSWIGGGGNFAAIKESVGAPDSIIGPIIIVDTAVGYTWTGVLLVLANYQHVFDRWNNADSSIISDLNRRIREFSAKIARPVAIGDVTAIVALGLIAAVVCGRLGVWLDRSVEPMLPISVQAIFSPFTWMVILITTLGIALSFTRLRDLEAGGASTMGTAALYLFLTSIGAKADLAALAAAPLLLVVGTVWIVIHVAIIFAGARWLRAPLFLVAVGSQANIGGAASAPIVAAAYYESMASVGVLMGIFGYLIGNYAGLVCAFLLSLVG